MFLNISIALVILISVAALILKRKINKLTPQERAILFIEQEKFNFYNVIHCSPNPSLIFKIMSMYNPRLFVSYFNLHNTNDVKIKRQFINKFSDDMLILMFKYSDYETLKKLFFMLDIKKMFFMLNWFYENNFKIFLPLFRSLDEPPEWEECYLLYNIIDESPEAMKFVKYVDNIDIVMSRFRKFEEQCHPWRYSENNNYIDDLALSFGIPI